MKGIPLLVHYSLLYNMECLKISLNTSGLVTASTKKKRAPLLSHIMCENKIVTAISHKCKNHS